MEYTERFERACNEIEQSAREIAEIASEFFGMLPHTETEYDCQRVERMARILQRVCIDCKRMEVR